VVEIEIKDNGEIEATLTRKRVHLEGKSELSPEPFHNGEQLSHIFGHEGPEPKKEWHKGNFIIITVKGNRMGYEAEAKCANEGCTVRITVFGV
jgi:hypothetical protein